MKNIIKFKTGNLFNSTAQVLVNAVNCEGVMGKGIALQFKRQYPEMFKDYREACMNSRLTIGSLHSFEENGKIIVNFPTKDKWREKSQLCFIEAGLEALTKFIADNNIRSIAIPPLGCGNGGLEWNDVETLITEKLKDVSQIADIEIFEPLS